MESVGVAVRKRRSQTARRPRSDAQYLHCDQSPMLSTAHSDDTSKVSSDENVGDTNSGGKMFNLNQCLSRSVPVGGSDGRSNVSVGSAVDGEVRGTESSVKKVKLKVGGVTRTIQTKSSSNGAVSGKSSTKTNQSSESSRVRQLVTQETSEDSSSMEKKSGFNGSSWKNFSRGSAGLKTEDVGKMPTRNAVDKLEEKSDIIRKSKRMPKRRLLVGESDEDDEIRYLEKLKTSKITIIRDVEAESTRKTRKDGKYDNLEDVRKPDKDAVKSSPRDLDYVEEEESLSDIELEGKKKKQKKDLPDGPTENRKELALTTRQRALLSKDASSASAVASQVEFPNGLPPAVPRKQKEVLTEVEQQMKKAEAAQRRKIQNEKAARESEAEAIRKILGQESSRKKREEKIKKRQEELAQERAANAQILSPNTIRCVMSPSGTTVSFSPDMGLPKIFDSKICSYPPPREKCAVPSCSNAYKYRDSKSNLPLCSLQCYKAVNGN